MCRIKNDRAAGLSGQTRLRDQIVQPLPLILTAKLSYFLKGVACSPLNRSRMDKAARMRSSMDMRCKRSDSAWREAWAEALRLGFGREETALAFIALSYEESGKPSTKAGTFDI